MSSLNPPDLGIKSQSGGVVLGERKMVIEMMNYSEMTASDKIRAAAIMFGYGSKQHLAAIQKFGSNS